MNFSLLHHIFSLFPKQNAISLDRIDWYSFKHKINACHNSCCKTSINCQAIKIADFNWEWKKLAQTNRSNKNVICLGRFGELPWSGWQLYCTCHHRQVDKQHSFKLYWISHRHWLERVFHKCNCLCDSDHWSKSEQLSMKCEKKYYQCLKVYFIKLDFHINVKYDGIDWFW